MSDNPVINAIKNRINKVNNSIDYYTLKSKDETFKRDNIEYINSEEWEQYWLDIVVYWQAQSEELYIALKYAIDMNLGDVNYPKPPINKVEK